MEEIILARSTLFCCMFYDSAFFINGSSIFCSISCINVFLNAIHLPHSRPAGSTMDIPASANVAYELSKFSSQLKEAIYE